MTDIQENLFGRAGPAVKFDPGKHPRNRLGRFSEILGRVMQEGGKVELPNGATVRQGRLGGLEVRNRKGKTIARTDVPAVAAAHALHIFDDARVKAGTNPDLIHNDRTAELEAARRHAVVAGSLAGIESVEGLSRSLKKARSERMPPFQEPNLVGRSEETRKSPLSMRARNRPEGHPLYGVKHPRREAVLATIRRELSDKHELHPAASPPDVQKYGPGHPRPGMGELERAGGLLVGGKANEATKHVEAGDAVAVLHPEGGYSMEGHASEVISAKDAAKRWGGHASEYRDVVYVIGDDGEEYVIPRERVEVTQKHATVLGDKHARKLGRRNEAVNVLGDAVTAAFRGDAVLAPHHGKKHKKLKHGKKVKHADEVLAGIRAAVAPA